MDKYFSMNTVPLGTKMKIKHNNKEGILLKIFHYPTTFKIGFNGSAIVPPTSLNSIPPKESAKL